MYTYRLQRKDQNVNVEYSNQGNSPHQNTLMISLTAGVIRYASHHDERDASPRQSPRKTELLQDGIMQNDGFGFDPVDVAFEPLTLTTKCN